MYRVVLADFVAITALLTKIRGCWGVTSCLLVNNEELTRWYIPASLNTQFCSWL